MDSSSDKDIVQNLIVLRFANQFFNKIWIRDSIKNIVVTFKEPGGLRESFGEFGILP
jgi:glucose-6-phosphate 1-dehydrogenase